MYQQVSNVLLKRRVTSAKTRRVVESVVFHPEKSHFHVLHNSLKKVYVKTFIVINIAAGQLH